jgi:hypothetical protein
MQIDLQPSLARAVSIFCFGLPDCFVWNLGFHRYAGCRVARLRIRVQQGVSRFPDENLGWS